MTIMCIVSNCMSGVVDSAEKVYLFHVPLDVNMQQKWAQAIPQTKEPLNTDHLVCEKHFLESDICRYHLETDAAGKIINKVSYDYPKLTDTAVPSIFPGYEVQLNGQNNTQPTVVQDVVYYQSPTSDVLSDIAFYSAMNNLTSGHCHHHIIETGTPQQFTTASTAPQPALVPPVANADPVNNGIPPTIPSVEPNQGSNPTDLATEIAKSPGDLQTVGSELSGNSNVTIPQDAPISNSTEIAATVQSADLPNVSNNIPNDSALMTGSISDTVTSLPEVPATDAIDIASTATPVDISSVSVDITDHADVVNSALTQASAVSEIAPGDSGLDAVTAITSQPSGWDNVITNEPVSSFADASTPFVSSDPKPVDGDDGCCCGDDDDCCGDDCCGDDCGDCDLGDCDCGDCDCNCGDCIMC